MRRVFCVLLPVAISIYLFYPLFAGKYLYYSPEYDIYKSFMINFVETLRGFELPVWNEYVGSGYPAVYFGQYPLNQNTIFYMIFGYSDLTAYIVKCSSVAILLISSIYAFRLLKLGYLLSLAGALTYLGVNLVVRFIIADTLGNLFVLYPLLIIFILKIIEEKRRKHILFFNLLCIFWLSGCHVAWIHEALFMLFLVFWVTAAVCHEGSFFRLRPLLKYCGLFLLLFVPPLVSVAYQYYFLADVITNSVRRVTEGLIVSPFESTAWEQLLVSFLSSSYAWIGLLLVLLYAIGRPFSSVFKKYPAGISVDIDEQGQVALHIGRFVPQILMFGFLLFLLAELVLLYLPFRFSPDFSDYNTTFASPAFLASMALLFVFQIICHRKDEVFKIAWRDCLLVVIYVSLLSYFFYLPSNIAGYDMQFFQELNGPLRVIFMFSVLCSMREFRESRIVRIALYSLVCLYFVRSHFSILSLRFTGVIWYSVRDGALFSMFFSILFVFGLRNMFSELRRLIAESNWTINALYVERALLIAVVALLVHGSYVRFYHGMSNRLIFPADKSMAKTSQEKWVVENRQDLVLLKKQLLQLARPGTGGFFRIFTPEIDMTTGMVLTGNGQEYGIQESALYDCTIPRDLKMFFDRIILEKGPLDTHELKNVLQGGVFTKHVHEGMNIKLGEVLYSNLFAYLLLPNDQKFIKEKNMEFFWDLMQVKYLLIGPLMSEVLESFADHGSYRLVSTYGALRSNLYEIITNKPYSSYAFLPLDEGQSYEDQLRQVNSSDISVLRSLYKKLVFPDDTLKDFTVVNTQRGSASRHYEIESERGALLIEFESWNHNWKVMVNNTHADLQKVFHICRGTRIQPGKNRIEIVYDLKYFKALFLLSIVVIAGCIILFAAACYTQRSRKQLF